jgi:type II secretory pathway component PulF
MPVFSYYATDERGRAINGTMPAQDETNLEEKLESAGFWLIDATVKESPAVAARLAGKEMGGLTMWGKAKRRALIEFCTMMSFQSRVGVPLVQALELASEDCESVAFRRVLEGLQRHIESGLLFYEALEKYPRIFSPHFVSVIRAGEMSSKLPETFEDLCKYLEWVDRIIADVRQASLYPAIVSVVILAFVLFLFSFIIPQFATLLTGLKIPLPLLTQVMFGVSDFVKGYWWVWTLLLLFLTVGIPVGRRVSRNFARWLDRVKLNLPIFGELNLMLSISRFTHNFAILYRSGIHILQALELCKGLVGNVVVEEAVDGVLQDVKTGSTISEAMRKHPVFPSMLLRMVTMGETTGSLDTGLENVSTYYNQVIPRRIKKVFTIMEPMLMLFLIGIVGAVALSIYLPLLALMGSIGK